MSEEMPEDVLETAGRGCKVDGCPTRHHAHGFCKTHYLRWVRYGDPNFRQRPGNGEAVRFYHEVVLRDSGNECLIWPFARDPHGYARYNGALLSRIVCEYENGPPPTPKHEAAHTCGNGKLGCVSRSHLTWKTRIDNEHDKNRHGTKAVGASNGRSRLSIYDAEAILSLRGIMTATAIAQRFGVSQSHVSDIHNGRKWAHLPRLPQCSDHTAAMEAAAPRYAERRRKIREGE